MRSSRYLDQLRQAKGFTNDTELADFLGVKQNTISQYRHAKGFMSNDVCLKVAAGLDMDNPLPVIMAADMDRAEKTGQKSLWEVFLPRMAGLSAALVLGVVTNFVTPSPAQAACNLENGVGAVYIM
ncbi:helix-turn-helix domain-containing protein [Paraburkholderia megapolitana]|uniref:Bacteriophage CI repressor helix-turn-helix domain-containing protein n=1 Tax=Paraburkholderia megapolitana TaxID=420953 RepID=A0A1I3RSA5_9BURK|nr:helix-turn-helix domain-containing protein [Paraburkholderia megapolitana]QDQ84024.1 Cro/Cl family transcriptional regulator [Paraburkholderia megapolitana]SFJ49215.1 Bacteriophage CI repressor helix-turn-helix domain-containing protein [Paraburkholderia megapolitana]